MNGNAQAIPYDPAHASKRQAKIRRSLHVAAGRSLESVPPRTEMYLEYNVQ